MPCDHANPADSEVSEMRCLIAGCRFGGENGRVPVCKKTRAGSGWLPARGSIKVLSLFSRNALSYLLAVIDPASGGQLSVDGEEHNVDARRRLLLGVLDETVPEREVGTTP